MKKFYFLLFTLLIITVSFGQVINEIDADTPGTDAAEFVELLWTPNTALDGYVVVFFNGNGDVSYQAFDLDGKTTDANGFFILANTALVSGTDLDIGASNIMQNGADAVVLYQASDTDFPAGTAVTSTNFVSGVVYDTDDGDDAGLLAIIGGVQYNENENLAKDTQSIQRKSDGTYEVKNGTFRADNNAATCDLSLTNISAACDAVTAGIDTYTATIDFTGGGTATYTVTADSGTVDLSSGNPTNDTTGTITVTGVAEGTDVVVTVTDGAGGLCNLNSTVFTPACNPSASLPFVDTFNYAVGSNLVDDTKWSNTSSSTDEVVVNSGSLSYTGLKPSFGNSVSFDGIGSDPELLFGPISSGTVYASFIFKVTSQAVVQDFVDGGYFAIIGSDATGFDARLWVRANPDNTSTQFDIGISDSASPPNVTSSLFNINDEIFVVMNYNTATGVINAWVNPASGDFGGTEPAATITATDTSPSPSLNRFVIRQDSNNETPSIEMDELRVGTSWADVTPNAAVASVREDDIPGFNMYPNPVTNGRLTINTFSNADKKIQIFDILGKRIISTNLRGNELNVSKLNSGIYILKILEEGKTATRKLVIK